MAYVLQTNDNKMHVLVRSLACTRQELPGEVCMFLGFSKEDQKKISHYSCHETAHTVAKYNNLQVDLDNINNEIDKAYWAFTRCAKGQPVPKELYERKQTVIEQMGEM